MESSASSAAIAEALRIADDVSTFPSISLPKPTICSTGALMKQSHVYSNNKQLSQERKRAITNTTYNNNTSNGKASLPLPGLGLRTIKPPKVDTRVSSGYGITAGSGTGAPILVGFNATNVKLTSGHNNNIGDFYNTITSNNTSTITKDKARMHTVDIGADPNLAEPDMHGGKKVEKLDPVMAELRNYTVLMDKYSLHNFVIYEGFALKDTPEFQSFKRTYALDWGAITGVIGQLEAFLAKHEVKVAIINGPLLAELAASSAGKYSASELFPIISNIEQVRPFLVSLKEASNNKKDRAVVKIQTHIRRKLAQIKYRRRIEQSKWVVRLQSVCRLILYKIRHWNRHRIRTEEMNENIKLNIERLKLDWEILSGNNADSLSNSRSIGGSSVGGKGRVVVIIPSISAAEYLRLNLSHFNALQNTNLTGLYQLCDEDTTVLYVSPVQMSSSDTLYHEKLMSVIGISTFPKRLHFIVPEMVSRLPAHVSVGLALWCSPHALRKIKSHTSKAAVAYVLPCGVTFAEKRIAAVLNAPLMAPDADVAQNLRSKSYAKKVFMDCSMNVAVGCHDIHSLQDLVIGMSRLIACNLDVRRWIVRLNYDLNNESIAVLDTSRLAVMTQLISEQEQIARASNISAWYSKQVQLNVRQRLLEVLSKELSLKLVPLNKALYGNFDTYMKYVGRDGCVVEAMTTEISGMLNGSFFINPLGEVTVCAGTEVIYDKHFRELAVVTPQTVTPQPALIAACKQIGEHLYNSLKVIGYVSVKFESYFDSLTSTPKLLALGIYPGFTNFIGACGVGAVAAQAGVDKGPSTSIAPAGRPSVHGIHSVSLCPVLSDKVHIFHIPQAVHLPLRAVRDDIFFKFCSLKGISFDLSLRTGVLFFLVDTILVDSTTLAYAGDTLWVLIEKALRHFHWADSIDSDLTKKMQVYLRQCLLTVSSQAQDLIFENLALKIDDLLASLDFINYVPTTVPHKHHELIQELTDFLQVTFMCLAPLPAAAREACHFACCSRISSTMKEFLFSDRVQQINALAVCALDLDIRSLELFADGCGTPQLRQCFLELKELVKCFLHPDLPSLDVRKMGTLFPRLDPARLASLLEKTAPTPACSNKFIPKMARGTVRSIVKNLRQAL